MAGAKDRVMAQAQQNFQQTSLQVIDALDKALDEYKARTLNVMKELKKNPDLLNSLQVSDTDYELVPEKPMIKDIRKEKAS